MNTFSNRLVSEINKPFAEGPVKTIYFDFKEGFVNPQNFSGRITYEWFNLMGAKYLVIHTVRFDPLLHANVQSLTNSTYYNYLVERAKESATFM